MRRFDTTLRAVMWLDAFLSAALVVVSVLASPLLATVGLPQRVVTGLVLAAIGLAVLLAALGAITFVLIMRRMSRGEYLLPAQLHLPLPAVMRPDC
jgi:fucose permease